MPPVHIVHYAEMAGSVVITVNIQFNQKANTASHGLGRRRHTERPPPNAKPIGTDNAARYAATKTFQCH